jgi:hypothetical protein
MRPSAYRWLSQQQGAQFDQLIDSVRSTNGILRFSGQPRELVFEQDQNHGDEGDGTTVIWCH